MKNLKIPPDLKFIFWEGLTFSIMVGAGESYFAVFALSLGMGDVLAGLLAIVPLLFGAILQLASPAILARYHSHRAWISLCAFLQVLSFMPLIYGALAGALSPLTLFLAVMLHWVGVMGTGPAWNTWMETLVPAKLRASFFAKRSSYSHLCILLALCSGGMILHWGEIGGFKTRSFVILFTIAAISRSASIVLFQFHREDRHLLKRHLRVSFKDLFRRFRTSWDGKLLFYMLITQFAVHIASPFFTPFMIRQLQLSYGQYMLMIAASFVAKMLFLPWFGKIAHHAGPAKIMLWGGLGIMPLPALWLVSDSFYYLLIVQFFSGTAWSAYELGTFLLFFDTMKFKERTSLLSIYNFFSAAVMSLGAVCGGYFLKTWVASKGGYQLIFILSTCLRLSPVLLLLQFRNITYGLREIVTRPLAVRPSAGAIERPIVATMEERD